MKSEHKLKLEPYWMRSEETINIEPMRDKPMATHTPHLKALYDIQEARRKKVATRNYRLWCRIQQHISSLREG